VGHPGITLRAGPESSLYWVFFGVFARGRPRAATGKHPKKHCDTAGCGTAWIAIWLPAGRA